jgi:hypothetical protein
MKALAKLLALGFGVGVWIGVYTVSVKLLWPVIVSQF